MIRIGNAQAFWGDRTSAAAEILTQLPDLDYLTMDYLAEVSMSILAQQQAKHQHLGYPQDFIAVVRSLADYWACGGRCKLIVNAGGLNPVGCAEAVRQALQQAGCRAMKIGICRGDDVLDILKDSGDKSEFQNLDDKRALSQVQRRLITANAYLGCSGIVDALNQDADIVITGRVADPSMVLAACVHAFGWPLDDWDRLAQGTVAGHLLECGTQVSGGISTDWLSIPDPAHMGFPYVEMEASGRCVVSKAGNGGIVSEQTVKEQLVYEIGDPARYLSPDVQVSFLSLLVKHVGENRVAVTGAKGSPRPTTLKVSATYADGYRAAGMLTIIGNSASQKARRSAEVVVERLADAGWKFRDVIVECLGALSTTDCSTADFEAVLRMAVESDDEAAVEAFSREMIPLVTAGAQGTTGYAEGRPRVHKVFRYWPCLIEANRTEPHVQLLKLQPTIADGEHSSTWPPGRPVPSDIRAHFARPNVDWISVAPESVNRETKTEVRRLIEVAFGRSGDKGTSANVGILVRNRQDYPWLVEWLTCQRVNDFFAALELSGVQRFELPNLGGLNFILQGALRRSGRSDAQGKALAQMLLAMPIS